MNAIVIDDESRARNVLRMLLEEHCPEILEIHEAPNLPEGVRMIRALQPAIVFLDIEMPGYSGLQLMDFIAPEEAVFELIFTTAYSEYAIRAFELNAIDYLLKPLQEVPLKRAVAKAVSNRGKSELGKRLAELKQSLETKSLKKIGLPMSDGTLFLELDDIIVCKAERMYTRVMTLSEKDIMISKPLRYLLEKLEPFPQYFQPHRSFLINLHHVRRYLTRNGGEVEMVNGFFCSVSQERREELQSRIGL